MLYLVGTWNFTLWPSREILANLSDGNRYTCVKFTSVQLGKTMLLKSTEPFRPIPPDSYVKTFWQNVAPPSECEPSILVMTQIGLPDTSDESLCSPFCGKLVRGNLSISQQRADWYKVVTHFSCDYRNPCKGMFIRITDKALFDPRLNLELCEIIFKHWYLIHSHQMVNLLLVSISTYLISFLCCQHHI